MVDSADKSSPCPPESTEGPNSGRQGPIMQLSDLPVNGISLRSAVSIDANRVGAAGRRRGSGTVPVVDYRSSRPATVRSSI